MLKKQKKTANIRIKLHSGTCVQPLLQRKSNEYYTTSVCVLVALDIQLAMCMRHIVICGLPCCAIFFHI
jgi:hypothetical protein